MGGVGETRTFVGWRVAWVRRAPPLGAGVKADRVGRRPRGLLWAVEINWSCVPVHLWFV